VDIMPDPMWTNFVAKLKDLGIPFEAGLTDVEFDAVERRFEFRFPPDLRTFLQAGLPCGSSFPNWRFSDERALRDWLDLPRQGILFDVEQNDFWLEEWGSRPATPESRKQQINELVSAAPRLIPVYSHRMMPVEPCEAGNPVFSVHQTDIIYYGVDLRDYLIREFFASDVGAWPIPEQVRRIRFWDVDRFQQVRWGETGSCTFDNSRNSLP
jgi:hypothetical protein